MSLDPPAGARGLSSLRRWAVWIFLGAAVAVGIAYLLLWSLPGPYSASSVIELDQPAITASGQQGLQTVQKLIDLIPTLAAQATSDDVLNRVRSDTGFPGTLQDLRDRVTAAPVTNQLTIMITASDNHAAVADGLARATVSEFETQLNQDEDAARIPPASRLAVTQLTHPNAQRPNHHAPRTLALTGVVTIIVLGGLVLLVDYLRT